MLETRGAALGLAFLLSLGGLGQQCAEWNDEGGREAAADPDSPLYPLLAGAREAAEGDEWAEAAVDRYRDLKLGCLELPQNPWDSRGQQPVIVRDDGELAIIEGPWEPWYRDVIALGQIARFMGRLDAGGGDTNAIEMADVIAWRVEIAAVDRHVGRGLSEAVAHVLSDESLTSSVFDGDFLVPIQSEQRRLLAAWKDMPLSPAEEKSREELNLMAVLLGQTRGDDARSVRALRWFDAHTN